MSGNQANGMHENAELQSKTPPGAPSSMALFCPNCSAYFPAGEICRCGFRRTPAQIPARPDAALWQADVPGAVATQMALARIGGQLVLLVPWYYEQRRGETRKTTGGVVALSASSGQPVWERDLGMQVEGGIAVGDDLVLVGMGRPGFDGGEGYLTALDLATGEERWPTRARLGAAARSAPVVDNIRVYAITSNGFLHCLDSLTGKEVWKHEVSPGAREMPASPVVHRVGATASIIVGTYGRRADPDGGKVVSVDQQNRLNWSEGAGGFVRAAPALSGGKLYVGAYRGNPSACSLSAFEVRSGSPSWREPFVLRGHTGDSRTTSFVASPLVHNGAVYVGCMDHHLYALDASTGQLKWKSPDMGHGIASAPVWTEGMVVVGANDGKVHALDAVSGEVIWDYPLGGHVFTGPLAANDLVFAASDNGVVVALPWHLGQYARAAERLMGLGDFAAAGDCYALAAHFCPDPAPKENYYQRAVGSWVRAGEPDKAARMWLALDQQDRAADLFHQAGRQWQLHEPQRAARHFQAAAELCFRCRDFETLNECTRLMAACLELPYIRLQAFNVPGFIQWETGELTLRLTNEGVAPTAGSIKLLLGGALKSAVSAEIPALLAPNQTWNIPLVVTPTRPDSALEVEVEFESGHSGHAILRGALSIPIQAAEKPRPPLEIGDVGFLQLSLGSTTKEGVSIVTRDVGMIRQDKPSME
ncbi:MAG: PQQ-binding-like beta-propeller repeat protein [Chloroflexi bacterium]|nr:PQQ-binding-like beta-propeller repeat protein [Chloroflexota bacterium]